jgi:flagellar basal body-associated protein FliL
MNRWSIVVGAVLLAVGVMGAAVWLLAKRGRPVVGAATPSGQAVVVAATPPPPGL